MTPEQVFFLRFSDSPVTQVDDHVIFGVAAEPGSSVGLTVSWFSVNQTFFKVVP